MSFDIQEYLKSHQILLDRRMAELLHSESRIPSPLLEAMRYSLLAPGKRLRPGLVFMACSTAGGADENAMPAACAVEMVHTYSLIHDDLPAMDDDDLRRGLPTCHRKFGEALAILAGDALLTMAFEVLASSYPARTAAAACLHLASGSGGAGMVGGQVEDLAWERSMGKVSDPLFPRTEQAHTLQALEHIHARKTGDLFRACLRLGVVAAQGELPSGPDPQFLAALDEYGRCFGLVFQITDDLLDVEGSAAATGKRTQKDAGRGKLTYPGLMGVNESRRHAHEAGERAFKLISNLGPAARPLSELMRFVLARKA